MENLGQLTTPGEKEGLLHIIDFSKTIWCKHEVFENLHFNS